MASQDDNTIDFQAKFQELNDGIEAYQRKAIHLLKKSKNEGDPLSETIEKYIIKTLENAKGRLKDLMQFYNSLDDSRKQRLYGIVKETLTVSSFVFHSIKEKIDIALSVVARGGSVGSNHQETVIEVSGLRSSIEAYDRKITDFMKSKKDGGSSTAGIEKLKKDLDDVNGRLNELTITDSLSDDKSKKKKQEDKKINHVLKMLNSQFEKTRDDIDLALEVGFALSEITTGSGGSNHQETLIGVSELMSSIKAYERKIIDFMKRKDGGSLNAWIEKLKKDLEDVKGSLNEIIMKDSRSDDDSKKEKQEDEKINEVLKMLNGQFEKTRDEIDFVVEVGLALSDITTGSVGSKPQETDFMKTKKKGGSKKKGKSGSKKR